MNRSGRPSQQLRYRCPAPEKRWQHRLSPGHPLVFAQRPAVLFSRDFRDGPLRRHCRGAPKAGETTVRPTYVCSRTRGSFRGLEPSRPLNRGPPPTFHGRPLAPIRAGATAWPGLWSGLGRCSRLDNLVCCPAKSIGCRPITCPLHLWDVGWRIIRSERWGFQLRRRGVPQTMTDESRAYHLRRHESRLISAFGLRSGPGVRCETLAECRAIQGW